MDKPTFLPRNLAVNDASLSLVLRKPDIRMSSWSGAGSCGQQAGEQSRQVLAAIEAKLELGEVVSDILVLTQFSVGIFSG